MHKNDIHNVTIGALGLMALTLTMFFDVLFLPGDSVLSNEGADLAFQFVHWRSFGFGQILDGNLPLWNPHIYCGAPFLAGFQSALLYPLNILYLLLPLAKAINWSIALHAFLGGFFFYLWAFKRGLHPLACFMAGAEFIFCAPYFLHIYAGHLPNLCTMIWAPLLFLAIDGIFERPSAAWCLLGVAAVSFMILAGHIQYAYYTGIAAGIYLAIRLYGASERLKVLLCFIIIFSGAAVLSAAQLLPGIEAGRDSLRGASESYGFATMFSFPPENLITWVAPAFFGDAVHFPYWGRWYLWEASLFVSVTGFWLAIYAVFFRQGRERLILPAMVVILLFLAMGSYMPWFSLLQDWLPGFKLFRGVSKFIFPSTLFVILLSAMGLDCLIREGLRKRKWALSMLAATAALSLILGLAITQSVLWPGFVYWIFSTGQVYLQAGTGPGTLAVAKAGEFSTLGLAVLAGTCILIAAILLVRISNFRKASLLVGLAIMELFWADFPARVSFPLEAAYPAQIVASFSQRPGDHRILNSYNPNLALSMGWRDIWGRDPLIPRRYGEFIAWMQQVNIAQVVSNVFPFHYNSLLKMLGCRTMLIPVNGEFDLVDLGEDVMPRASLVGQWAVEADRDRAFAILGQPGFDPLRLVVLERDPNLPPAAAGENPGTVRVTETSTDHLTLEANVNAASILVVTDNYTEGWRILPLAGSASNAYEIIPANYALRGVPLTPGHHHFRMEYRPISFVIGVWLSAAGVIAWLAVAVLLVWRKRYPDAGGDVQPESRFEAKG